MSQFVKHGDFLWPAEDDHCHKVIGAEIKDMDAALELVKGRSIAVQAGGNVGVWAAHLAKQFELVYTAEPDQENYHCLKQNVPNNVRHYEAAFANRPGHIKLECDPKNVGAHYVNGKGSIVAMTIDSLGLLACDYLCLDVEGFEPLALEGAVETIREFRPVIQIEEKGLSARYYNIARGTSAFWLAENFGYRVVKKVRKDLILSCEPV